MNGKAIGCSMGAAVLLLTAGFSGRVVDEAGNGVPGVVLSDGERAVRSAADGRYEFPDGGRFVRLVEPANARADRRWCPMTPGEEGIFRLTPAPAQKRVRFAQVSDVETWGKEDYFSEDWLNVLGDLCRAEKTDFLLHTGDICYPQGLEFNARAVTEGQMGVPVFFLPGNHDMTQGAYGEERYAPAIARAIVQRRAREPIETTGELAELIRGAMPGAALREAQHPAKRTFQAIRIAVNDELAAVEELIPVAVERLAPGGRLAVITFHSLEDRIVKQSLQGLAKGCICPPDFPVCTCGQSPKVRLVTRKPIQAAPGELEENPRARSAKLRVAERI